MKDTKELRDAVETVQPERVKLALRLGQSRALYEGFQVLATACHTLGVLTMAVLSDADSMHAQPQCSAAPIHACGAVWRHSFLCMLRNRR